MDIGDRRIDMDGNEYAELSTYHEEQPPSPNISGIYIKVGDDSIGDYRTFYLGNGSPEQVGIWEGLTLQIIECVEGLITYHEERQQSALPGMTKEDMESRKAQGWRFAPEIDQIYPPK